MTTPPTTTSEDEPNPPIWPESVIFIKGTDDAKTIQSKIEHTQDSYVHENDHPEEENGDGGITKVSTFTCDHHFSDRRYVVLFEPGRYEKVELQVGYYVQVCGLGTTPDHVQFHNGLGPFVPSLNRHIHHGVGTCLDTFWRSGENFSVHGHDMKWAVSQASPLRRVHVTQDLFLHDKAAYASGGFIADSVVDGHTHFGGQQQYLSRNVTFGQGSMVDKEGGASGGAWGMVFVGCDNAPSHTSPGPEDTEEGAAVTCIDDTPVRIEKPYVAMYDDDNNKNKFQLRVPKVSFPENGKKSVSEEESRDFSKVRLVTTKDTTAAIQEALDAGKDVVLTPGIYNLDRTLVMKTNNQVLLGLGLATLTAPAQDGGAPCIQVEPNTEGVRIAGVMLEAPPVDPASATADKSTAGHWSLLEFGRETNNGNTDDGNPKNPGGLFDIFCRVGGGGPASQRKWINIDSMVRIHSGNVIGDNLWLWRADHAELEQGEAVNCPEVSPVFYQTEKDEYNVDTGIIVTGNNVTIYGLAVEHTSKHQTIWKGEDGTVFFYQCEFPYDVDVDFGTNGYRGYYIDDSVQKHTLYSPGIYSNFRNAVVNVETAIEHPTSNDSKIRIVNPFTVHLDNNGLIKSIVNGMGPPAAKKGTPTRLVAG